MTRAPRGLYGPTMDPRERLGEIPARGLPRCTGCPAQAAHCPGLQARWTPCTAPWPGRAASHWDRAMAQLLDGLDVVYAAEEPAESSDDADDDDSDDRDSAAWRIAG